MAKKKAEDMPAGSPAWMSTFSDLMNLLLCFFVLLFSMSTVEEAKFEALVESFAGTVSVLPNGASVIGDGKMISNGVSQLDTLSQYWNQNELEDTVEGEDALEEVEQMKLNESEEMAESIENQLNSQNIASNVEVGFNSQYVVLTLSGSLLFDSGSANLKSEATPVLDKVAAILEKYNGQMIKIVGHTDNVPMESEKYEDNEVLSFYRAYSVADYLIMLHDLNPSLVEYSGRSEYEPIASNATAEGRAQNRRVEIKIYNTLSDY